LLEMVPAVAVKVALEEPAATVTEAGTVRAATLLESDTAAPPDAAAADNATVQVEVAPVARLAGTQDSELKTTGANSETEAVWETPLKVAVTTAVWLLEMVPAVAVKVALEEPAATATEPGTARAATLLESDTAAPPDAAAADNATVQVDVAPVARLAGTQDNEFKTGANSESETVWELLFSAAVITALWLVATEPAVAENTVDEAPDATVTEAGTASAALLLDSETVVALVATWLSDTVQFDTCAAFSDPGLQVSPLTCGTAVIRAVTVAAAPLMDRAAPPAEAPSVFVTPMVVLATVGARVTVTTATTPFWSTPEFSPATRHS